MGNDVMPSGQQETGFKSEENPNEPKGVRPSGVAGGQPRTGHLLEDSPNVEARTGRPDGTTGGQPGTGHLSEKNANPKTSDTPDRTDTIKDV